LIGSNICLGPLLQLLQIRRKFQERHILAAGHISRDSRVRKIFPKVKQQNNNGVDNYGDVYGFTPAGARQVVLQLNEQVRNPGGIVIQVAVGGFPSLGVVEAELLRLRLLGRGGGILERNLGYGHELSCSEPSWSVRHRFPSPRCIYLSK